MPMATSPVHLPPSPCATPPESDSGTHDSQPEHYYHSYLHDQTPRRAEQHEHVTDLNSVPQSKYDNGIASTTSLQSEPFRAPVYGRQCSINHTTHKTFLEPICDDCLLDELGVQKHSEPDILPSVSGSDGDHELAGNEVESGITRKDGERGRSRRTRNGSGLIWSSDVQIEITPSPTSTNGPAEKLPGELVDRQTAASNAPASPVDHTTPDNIHLAQVAGSVKKRSLPFTHDPSKRISSSMDLARRRPWLVKELEAYLDTESGAKYTAPQEGCPLANNAKDAKILESSVEVEVLDDSGLNNAMEAHLLSPGPGSPAFLGYRFPSTHFPHARPPSAIDTTSPTPTAVDTPHHQRSSLSASTFTADADDESSLHTSSPIPATSTVLSPNVTQRRPKPRSNTKVVRRRGMDISRSSFALRISSRWGSAERECLRGFKDDLLGRSPKHQEKSDFKDNALDGNSYVPLGREQEHKKDLKQESNETVGAEATSNGESKTEWSREIFENRDGIRMSKGQNDANAAEVGDISDLDADPAQPAPIKLHRSEDFVDMEVNEPADTAWVRGRHRSRSPVKNLLTRFAEAQNGGKTWAKGVLGDLKRSLSRDSRPRGRGGRYDARHCPCAGLGANSVTSAELATPGLCTFRAVVDSSEDIAHAQGGSLHSKASQDADSTRRGSAQTSASAVSGSVTEGNLYLHPTESRSVPASSESWHAHLSHDMALPRRSKKHILRNAALSKSEVRLPTDVCMERHGPALQRRNSSAVTMNRNFISRSSPLLPSVEYGYPPEARYYHQHQTGNDDEESKMRLLSSSSGRSIPVTASSRSSGAWFGHESGSASGSYSAPGSANWKWKGERLASIVSSSEFEVGNELVENPWNESKAEVLVNDTAGSPSNQVFGREHTLARGVLEHSREGSVKSITASYQHPYDITPSSATHPPEYHQQLPRPRNPTPSSAPTFRFKPHIQPQPTNSKSAQVLTKHPLSTPLRISTPNRPNLPLRTTSLSSPPLSTLTRMGLPASKTALTHSPTEHFACIWKRYLCAGVDGGGGCGRIAKEEVISCICGWQRSARLDEGEGDQVERIVVDKHGSEEEILDSHGEEVVCRSTAPVVRYVESASGLLGRGANEESDYPEDKTGVEPRCEQCKTKVAQ